MLHLPVTTVSTVIGRRGRGSRREWSRWRSRREWNRWRSRNGRNGWRAWSNRNRRGTWCNRNRRSIHTSPYNIPDTSPYPV